MRQYLIILILLAFSLNEVTSYTVKDFNKCLTSTCGSYACWKATDEKACTSLMTKYSSCLTTESACTEYLTQWTKIKSDSTAAMVSYSGCYEKCSSTLNNDDYLTYYYHCYAECSDNLYSGILTFSITFLLLSLMI